MRCGDNGASYDYAFLIAKGLTDCEDSEIVPILKDLLDKGLITPDDDAFIMGDWNPFVEFNISSPSTPSKFEGINVENTSNIEFSEEDRVWIYAAQVRRMLESKINSILRSRRVALTDLSLEEKINLAYDRGYISHKEMETYHDARKACNKSGLHPDEIKVPKVSDLDYWAGFIKGKR